jgi:dATP pyrophosphohydrolase
VTTAEENPAIPAATVILVRDGATGLEVLMLHRSPGRAILPGLWQGVSGSIEPGEGIVDAALREVREETGIDAARIDRLYSLDFVASFLWEPLDTVLSSVYFALRVPSEVEPSLSDEHDTFEWLSIDEAISRSAWPAYREALARVRDCLLDPDRAPWFELAMPREASAGAEGRAVD